MTQSTTQAMVRKSVTVEAAQARAFTVFTGGLASWWPLEGYHIGDQPAVTAVVEPRAGGRWFERAADGTECDWGRVLVWEPPNRVVLSWAIDADFKADPTIATEVEVRFISEGPTTTRVELEHRGLEQFGERAAELRAQFDSEGGWGALLALFAGVATS
jgi:uncharacterized protein YndB with AHSA1/START domain